MNPKAIYNKIANCAVNATYLEVYYRIGDTVADNAEHIKQLTAAKQQEFLQKEVSKLLPVFTKKYGICANKEQHKKWTDDIAHILFSGVEDGFFFKKPEILFDIIVRYLMPPKLFDSMRCHFILLEIGTLQFKTIIDFIQKTTPGVGITDLRLEENNITSELFEIHDIAGLIYYNMQEETPFI